MTKQFKIGEYAIGGIIKVDVKDDKVTIDALDYMTKKPVPFVKCQFHKQEQWEMYLYLSDITTSYYADKILNHIYNKK
jgi:hypothetical protein